MSKAAAVQGPKGNATYARILRSHEILRGFDEYLRAAGRRISCACSHGRGRTVLAALPPYPAFPPEMVYPPPEPSLEPAIVLGEHGRSRLAYIPGDLDRSFWRSGNPDLSRLLKNTIGWLVHDQAAGDGHG